MLLFTYLPGTNSFLISNLPNLSVTSSPLDLGTVTGNWIGCIFCCCNWWTGASTLPAGEGGVSLPLIFGVPRPLTFAEIISEKLSSGSSSFSKSTDPTEWLEAPSEIASCKSLVFPVKSKIKIKLALQFWNRFLVIICKIYTLTCLRIVVSNTYCVVFLFCLSSFILCILCCQYLWIVHFLLSLQYYLTFTYTRSFISAL